MITEGEAYYQENFQVDAFMHQHYGQKIFYTEESEREEAWQLARSIVKNQFKKNNPHLFEGGIQVYTMPQELPSQQIEKTGTPIDAIINGIFKSESLDELKQFKILASTDQAIQAAYNLQQLKLKNK